MHALTYSRIVALNRELGEGSLAPPYRILLLSNAVVGPLKEILEYSLREGGINAHVDVGNYDNIVQDSAAASGYQAAVIFWELWNVVDGLPGKISLLSSVERASVLNRLTSGIDTVFGLIGKLPLVIFNRFSAAPFAGLGDPEADLDLLSVSANRHLQETRPENTILVDCDRIFREISVSAAMDWRLFYSARSPYTLQFYKEYARQVQPCFLAACGKAKKALILDCDNTLWSGILGEDGADGIQMSEDTPRGRIFAEVQRIVLGLQKRGVILGLCSRNNPEDVDTVLATHPHMLIRDEHLAIKKVNWANKVDNLKGIADELNLGLDAIVFVDDSRFEIEFVNKLAPQVRTIVVPEALAEFPHEMRQASGLFFQLSRTAEDAQRTAQYQQQALRRNEQRRFADTEDYLRSLSLALTIDINCRGHLARMAQLTQKTNQFNLTTRRYTQTELEALVEQPDSRLFSLGVADSFGDYGLTGLAILKVPQPGVAHIDTLLLSCRVLGRNVEYAFFNSLIAHLREDRVKTLHAIYRSTARNGQVADFYESLGFEQLHNRPDGKDLVLRVDDYQPRDVAYISVRFPSPAQSLSKC